MSLLFLRPKLLSCPITTATLSLSRLLSPTTKPKPLSSFLFFSTTSTPYPLQYDLILNRPAHPPTGPRTRTPRVSPNPDPEPEDPSLDSWVNQKLDLETEKTGRPDMDKSKRKYYSKRRKRMYGSDSEDELRNKNGDGFVELKPEVVEFHRLHKREEELYFYDAFAYPWEKDKHYKMVYQLEKKYFPDQCLDKAFLEPGEGKEETLKRVKGKGRDSEEKRNGVVRGDKKLVFFEESESERERERDGEKVVTERKVEDFFKGLKRVPSKEENVGGFQGEPYLVSRSSELPPTWDSSNGTVVLINKPKG